MKNKAKGKKLNLDIKRSITKSVGRFVSIMLLMALGSFALVGLFVTGPDMRATGNDYFRDLNTADLTIMSDYGIDSSEIQALQKDESIKDIECSYMKDVVIAGTDKAFRLSSLPEKVSKYELKEGDFPKAQDEIAIDNSYNGEYKIGDTIEFTEKAGGSSVEIMKVRKFKIVGFVYSSEIITSVNRGVTNVGTGTLEGYGVTTKDAFDIDVFIMAKLTFNETAGLDSFGKEYADQLKIQKDKINDLLKTQEQARVKSIKEIFQKKLDEGKQKIEDGKTELNNAKKKLEDGKVQLENGQKKLDSAQIQIQEGDKALDKAKSQLEKVKAEYKLAVESGLVPKAILLKLKSEIVKGQAEYDQGKAALDSAKSEYKKGQEELQKNKEEYEKGLKEYNEKEPSALKDIKDGEKELAKQQAKLNELTKPTYMVLTRRELPGGEGNKTYGAISNIVDSLANVFPIFLYFVAALVTLTTMTRYVSEERINAGTLKALGYKSKDIIKKFIAYGLLAGLSGTIIGIVLGHTLMPYIAYSAYSVGVTIYPIRMGFYPVYTIAAIIVSLVSTILPTYIAAKNELRETPASLLLPKAPKPGTKILLEKIKFIWSRLSFTYKVTFRNIFRYKSRMLMTIIGVAGATAVLFTGLAIQGSVSDIKDRQFIDILKYDMIVAQNEDLDSEEVEELNSLLKGNEVSSYKSANFEEASITAGAQNDKQQVRVVVPSDTQNISDYLSIYDADTGQELSIDNGPIISERLATLLDLKKGDTLKFQDSQNENREVKIAGICEMYAGHFLFMNKADYEHSFGKNYQTNAQIVLLKDNSLENTRVMANTFVNLTGVKTVIQNTTIYEQMNTIVNALDEIMLILIFIAAMLGVVIIYNLTNINVMERIRELSTIKVLGFRDKEVTMYIYRETIFLTIIAIIVGCLIGLGIHGYILDVLPADEVMFRDKQFLSTFLIPTVVIALVTFFTGLYVYHKLKHIDMLEALKSVE